MREFLHSVRSFQKQWIYRLTRPVQHCDISTAFNVNMDPMFDNRLKDSAA